MPHRGRAGRIVLVAALCCACGVGPGAAQPVSGRKEHVLFDNATGYWRALLYWKTPQLLREDGTFTPLREPLDPRRHKTDADRGPATIVSTTPPPKGWFKPDFDDSAWVRQHGAYGPAPVTRPYVNDPRFLADDPATMAVICLRGTIDVKDPAACKDLQVLIEYYGGVVIYVNGEEVKRQHLPHGELKAETLAEQYEKDAYTREAFEIEEYRIRKLKMFIRPKMLKKGTNVIAVGVHRAPFSEIIARNEGTKKVEVWSHAFVKRVMLYSMYGMIPKGMVTNIDKPTRVILSEPPEDGTVILDLGSYWRCHFTWTQRWPRHWEWSHTTSLPPADWTKPDFDDETWARWRIGRKTHRYFSYGVGTLGQAVRLLCMRGKFTVKKPAQADLTLWLAYRGGMVVSVNGHEIARQHLPKDAAPVTLADAYPHEAFYVRKGRPFMTAGGELGTNKELADLRVRKLSGVTIPNDLLRPGTNVLALEIHAAPFDEPVFRIDNLNFRSHWNPCGLISVILHTPGDWQIDAVRPNVTRPDGVHVFNANVMDTVLASSYGDPHDPLRPIRIVAARNGAFCGKVVLACTPAHDINRPAALRKVGARMSDLKQTGGGVIPASAVDVLYARYEPVRGRLQFDGLLDTPPAEIERRPLTGWDHGMQPGAVQPIWIKVHVPADAAPGDYEGTLTVQAQGLNNKGLEVGAVNVPVRLRVIGWTLPEPRDYLPHLGLVQSPESVALQYKVPLWSQKHWELIEKSWALMGEAGNKYVVIPLITRTNFGNSEGMVRWVKDGTGGYTHDFSLFDRYLDLAQKYTKPDVVCIYIWDKYMASLSWGTRPVPGVGAKVTRLDPATGQVSEMEGPTFEDPAAKAFWKPVLDEVVARLKKRGLDKHMMFGIYCERAPSKGTVSLLKELQPGVPWIENAHGYYGGLQGVPVGYHTQVYVYMFPPPQPWTAKRRIGWALDVPCDFFPRGIIHPSVVLGVDRVITEAAQMANKSGLGRNGADFWPVVTPDDRRRAIKAGAEKRSLTITSRYPESSWYQLNMDTSTEAFLAPGPDGAVTTSRFENLREGMIECHARIFIEKALAAGSLGSALAEKCRRILDERALLIRAAWIGGGGRGGRGGGYQWYGATVHRDLAERLFTCAGEVARALQKGKPGT